MITIGIDHNDLDDIQSFVEALRRAGSVPSTRYTPPTKAWQIVNPDGSVAYTCDAYDEIAALDKWAASDQMGSYTEALRQHVLDGHGPEFGLPVYRHEGVIHAIHSNYEVTVREAASWKIVQVVSLVREDEAEDLHSFYGRMTENDESCGGYVETRDLTDQEAIDFASVMRDAEVS